MADKSKKIKVSDKPEKPAQGIQASLYLRYSTSAKSTFALDIDINMPAPCITAILRQSGSRKTSFFRCIARLV